MTLSKWIEDIMYISKMFSMYWCYCYVMLVCVKIAKVIHTLPMTITNQKFS